MIGSKHTVDGWYIDAALKHYCGHRVWNEEKKQKELATHYFFKHSYITQPTLTPENTLLKAVQDLCHVLQKNTKRELDCQVIKKLNAIFNSPQNESLTSRVDAPAPSTET